MGSSIKGYIIYYTLYFARIVGFLLYLSYLIPKKSLDGIKLSSVDIFIIWLFSFSNLVSFVALSYVFLSKKSNLFATYIVIELNTLVFSFAIFPYSNCPHIFLIFLFPTCFEIIYVFYNSKRICRTGEYIQARKIGVNTLIWRALKVRTTLIAVRFLTYLFFFTKLVIKFIHCKFYTRKVCDVPHPIYLLASIELLADFYEKEEKIILKVISNISIFGILAFLIFHWLINFDYFKG